MKCTCKDIKIISYLEDVSDTFLNNLELIDSNNLYDLYKCKRCKQHWRINNLDKFIHQFVVKLQDKDNWENEDYSDIEKEFILEYRGGLSDDECMKYGCDKNCVRGTAYCIDHLYELGVKK